MPTAASLTHTLENLTTWLYLFAVRSGVAQEKRTTQSWLGEGRGVVTGLFQIGGLSHVQ